MINLLTTGKEAIDKILTHITELVKERTEQGKEIPEVIHVYASNETLRNMAEDAFKLKDRDALRHFTYSIEGYKTVLYFVPCEFLPFGQIDYSFF